MGVTNASTTDSWDGTSVIVTGNEHQFPPVACSMHEALCFPSQPSQDSALSLIGQPLYEEFCMVIMLKQQVHVIDPVWNDFLCHLQHGQVQP